MFSAEDIIEDNVVLVIDCSNMDIFEKTAAVAFQGIVNKKGPKIFLETGKQSWINKLINEENGSLAEAFSVDFLNKYKATDSVMLDNLTQYYKLMIKRVDFNTAIIAYKKLIAGTIEYDEEVTNNGQIIESPARTSAAITAAGIYNCIPVTNSVKSKYKALDGFKVLVDLKGKFESEYQAHQRGSLII